MADTVAGKRANQRIRRVGTGLEVPDSTITTAQALFDQVHAELDFEGRSADPLAAAALTVACRQSSLPVTANDITREWGRTSTDATGDFPVKFVTRRLDTVSEVTGVNPPPADPTDLAERYGGELGVPDGVVTAAINVLHDLMREAPETVTRGTSPSGNAAAALYLAGKVNDVRLEYTQSDISDVADVSEVTIRNRYKEMAEALGGGEMTSRDRYTSPSSDDESAPEGGSVPASSEPDGGEVPTNAESGESESGVEDESQSERIESNGAAEDETEAGDGDLDDGSTTVDLGLQAYLALKSAADQSSHSESEIVTEAVRSALKSLLGGDTLRPVSSETTTTVTTDFPDRIDRLLDAELSDPTCEFDTRGEFVSAAVLAASDSDGSARETVETVHLPDHVLQAAERVVERSDDYGSIVELVKRDATGQVIEE